MECDQITTNMLLTMKKHNKVIDVPPGYREDNGKSICYVEQIDRENILLVHGVQL